jgi:hypothetical protein
MGKWTCTVALALTFAATGYAQLQRPLPADGRLGELASQQQQPFPLLQINKKVVRLAPGGRIYDQQNRMIVHGSLPDAASVLFIEDLNGDIVRMYLLLPAELQQLKPAATP